MANTVPKPSKLPATYHMQTPVTIKDKQVTGGWGASIVNLINRLTILNTFASHVTVSQENEESKLQFTATWNAGERTLSALATGAMVFFAQRLCGRRGIAYAALGQLGLSLGVALFKSSSWAPVQAALRKEHSIQYGQETHSSDLSTTDQTAISANIGKELKPLISAALDGGIVEWFSGANATQLKECLSRRVQEGGAGLVAAWLCNIEEAKAEGMDSIREALATQVVAYIDGDASRIPSVMKGLANASTDNKDLLAQIVGQVIKGVKPEVVKETIKACGKCDTEVAVAGFNAFVARKGGSLEDVVKLYSEDELKAIAPHLEIKSQLAFVRAISKTALGSNGRFCYQIAQILGKNLVRIDVKRLENASVSELTESVAQLFNALKDEALGANFGPLENAAGDLIAKLVSVFHEGKTSESEDEGKPSESEDVVVTRELFFNTASSDVLKAVFRVPALAEIQIAVFDGLPKASKEAAINAAFSTSGALNNQAEFVTKVLKGFASNISANVARIAHLVNGLEGVNLEDVGIDTLALVYSFGVLANLKQEGLFSKLEEYVLTCAQTEQAQTIYGIYQELKDLKVGSEETAQPALLLAQLDQILLAIAPDGERVAGFTENQIDENKREVALALAQAHWRKLHGLWIPTIKTWVYGTYDQTEAKKAVLSLFNELPVPMTQGIAADLAKELEKLENGKDFADFVTATVAGEANQEESKYTNLAAVFAHIKTALEAPKEEESPRKSTSVV